jgi:hypothetical protein
MQKIFSPLDYGFTWTDGWYTFDYKAAHAAALKARNAEAKRLRAAGKQVVTFALPDQLMSRGGIGSGYPHIELHVNCYGLNAYEGGN